jgi:hypothetical protein
MSLKHLLGLRKSSEGIRGQYEDVHLIAAHIMAFHFRNLSPLKEKIFFQNYQCIKVCQGLKFFETCYLSQKLYKRRQSVKAKIIIALPSSKNISVLTKDKFQCEYTRMQRYENEKIQRCT